MPKNNHYTSCCIYTQESSLSTAACLALYFGSAFYLLERVRRNNFQIKRLINIYAYVPSFFLFFFLSIKIRIITDSTSTKKQLVHTEYIPWTVVSLISIKLLARYLPKSARHERSLFIIVTTRWWHCVLYIIYTVTMSKAHLWRDVYIVHFGSECISSTWNCYKRYTWRATTAISCCVIWLSGLFMSRTACIILTARRVT